MGKVKADDAARPGRPVTIGRAATAAGLTPKAVRLYEARGLLPTPDRAAAGYRLYTAADIDRLRFIAAARRLGLHIEQISDIPTSAHDGRRAVCDYPRSPRRPDRRDRPGVVMDASVRVGSTGSPRLIRMFSTLAARPASV